MLAVLIVVFVAAVGNAVAVDFVPNEKFAFNPETMLEAGIDEDVAAAVEAAKPKAREVFGRVTVAELLALKDADDCFPLFWEREAGNEGFETVGGVKTKPPLGCAGAAELLGADKAPGWKLGPEVVVAMEVGGSEMPAVKLGNFAEETEVEEDETAPVDDLESSEERTEGTEAAMEEEG